MIYNLPKDSDQCADILKGWTLVDGSFDPVHHGHIKYFNEALLLGNRVGCLLAPDSYTQTKHKVLLRSDYRAIVLASLKQIDMVFYGEIETSSAIELLRPNIFFKGGDWQNRLSGEILDACKKVNCQIIIGSPPIESSSKLLINRES